MAKIKITREFSDTPADQKRAAKAVLKALLALQKRDKQIEEQRKEQVG